MHPHLDAVFTRFDVAHAALHAAMDQVPDNAHSVRPAPDRWSANQVLEHVSLVERAFTQRLTGVIAARTKEGLTAERSERTGLPEQIRDMMRDRTSRRNAPDAAQPTGTLSRDEAWAAIEETRDQLRRAVTTADGLALSGVTYAHPIFGSLTVYQWVELLAEHRERHAAQIRETAAQLRGSAVQG